MDQDQRSKAENRSVLGIIRLDCDESTEESSSELIERNAVTPFSYESPAFWNVPFLNAIARGADAVGNKIPTVAASRGIVEAANRLDGRTQLIIGDCGYMWASREHLYGRTSTPTIMSALEFLDLALRMTSLPIGIITWDEKPLKPLLHAHPGFDRLRFLSVADLPEWAKWAEQPDNYMQPGGWTKERMAQQFGERLSNAFAEAGSFSPIGLLILECTLVPDFRKTIRSLTPVPVLDLLNFAKTALE